MGVTHGGSAFCCLSLRDWSRILLFLLLFLCGSMRSAAVQILVLPNCTIIGITLPTANYSVNASCTSVVFSNVVVQGDMTLNISIAGIVMANPTAGCMLVTLDRIVVQTGATVAIDSTGYTETGGGPIVSIVIQSLIGNDGCLAFLGTFPPRTSVLVRGAQMVSSTSAAPMLPNLDPANPTRHKMIMLVNLVLTGNSSMIFFNSSLVATNPTSSFVIDGFYTTGDDAMTLSASSALTFRNCSVSTSNGDPIGFYNDILFTDSSYVTVTACVLTTTAGDEAFGISGSATFTRSSFVEISSCTMSAGGGYSAFVMSSPASFSDFKLHGDSINRNGRSRSRMGILLEKPRHLHELELLGVNRVQHEINRIIWICLLLEQQHVHRLQLLDDNCVQSDFSNGWWKCLVHRRCCRHGLQLLGG